MELNSIYRPLILLGLTMASALPLNSQAQGTLDTRLAPVNITGSLATVAPRHDVSHTCPDVAASLKDSLADLVYRLGKTGEMKVEFQLNGNGIDSVSTQGGPWVYRRPMRHAVRVLNCVNDGQTNQKFSFVVVFKQSDEQAGRDEAVALHEGPPQTLAIARSE